MSETVTALGGARFEGTLRIAEQGPQGMITIRGDLGTPEIVAAIEASSGLPIPAPLSVEGSVERGLCWMSPDELLLLCPHAQVADKCAQITQALGAAHALVVDVSDARAVFTLQGAGVRETLAKLTPADTSEAALPVGRIRRSRLAQVAGAFWLTSEQSAQVICFRSVATYVFDLLSAAAMPGSEVH